MTKLSKVDRLKAKVADLQSKMYDSPFFYDKWKKAKNELTQIINQNKGKQLSL
jgi:hypothetical protein